MRVVAVMSDLMLYSRIESAASAADAPLVRMDDPSEVPPDTDLVLVDWSAREPSWTGALRAVRDSGARIILFGPHTDLDAHAAARSAQLQPMVARSRVIAHLRELLAADN